MTPNRELEIHGGRRRLAKAATIAAAFSFAVVALAQEGAIQPPQPQQQPETAPPAPAPPAFQPGFIDAVGQWLTEGTTKLKSEMGSAKDKLDAFGTQAQEAAKDATGTIMVLPASRPTGGRERCAPAANGAPDCQTAAITLCRGKGFQSGKTLDTQSEQKCSARLLLQGRAPNASDCTTEMFVTRAICQ